MDANTAGPILLTLAGLGCEFVAAGLAIEKHPAGVLIWIKKWIDARRRSRAVTLVGAPAEARSRTKIRGRLTVVYPDWESLDAAARIEQLYNRITNLESADGAILDRLGVLEDDAERTTHAIDHARREAENKLDRHFTITQREAREAATWLIAGAILGAGASIWGALAG